MRRLYKLRNINASSTRTIMVANIMKGSDMDAAAQCDLSPEEVMLSYGANTESSSGSASESSSKATTPCDATSRWENAGSSHVVSHGDSLVKMAEGSFGFKSVSPLSLGVTGQCGGKLESESTHDVAGSLVGAVGASEGIAGSPVGERALSDTASGSSETESGPSESSLVASGSSETSDGSSDTSNTYSKSSETSNGSPETESESSESSMPKKQPRISTTSKTGQRHNVIQSVQCWASSLTSRGSRGLCVGKSKSTASAQVGENVLEASSSNCQSGIFKKTSSSCQPSPTPCASRPSTSSRISHLRAVYDHSMSSSMSLSYLQASASSKKFQSSGSSRSSQLRASSISEPSPGCSTSQLCRSSRTVSVSSTSQSSTNSCTSQSSTVSSSSPSSTSSNSSPSSTSSITSELNANHTTSQAYTRSSTLHPGTHPGTCPDPSNQNCNICQPQTSNSTTMADIATTRHDLLEKIEQNRQVSATDAPLSQEKDKYLIFTMGTKTYTPHQIGVKKINAKAVSELMKKESPARRVLQPPDDHQEEEGDQEYDGLDHVIELNGHIIGMCLSPDHRYL